MIRVHARSAMLTYMECPISKPITCWNILNKNYVVKVRCHWVMNFSKIEKGIFPSRWMSFSQTVRKTIFSLKNAHISHCKKTTPKELRRSWQIVKSLSSATDCGRWGKKYLQTYLQDRSKSCFSLNSSKLILINKAIRKDHDWWSGKNSYRWFWISVLFCV